MAETIPSDQYSVVNIVDLEEAYDAGWRNGAIYNCKKQAQQIISYLCSIVF